MHPIQRQDNTVVTKGTMCLCENGTRSPPIEPSSYIHFTHVGKLSSGFSVAGDSMLKVSGSLHPALMNSGKAKFGASPSSINNGPH